MIRKLATFALIAVIMFSSTVSLSIAQTTFLIISSTWGTPSSLIEAEPGDRNIPLTLTAQYTGSLVLSRMTVILHPPTGFADSNGASHPVAHTSTIQPNTIFQLGFNLNIASNVQLGTHTFTVQFTYTRTDGSTDEESIDTTVRLNGKVNMIFQHSETSLNPGVANAISFRLKNSGSGDATKISVTISPPPQVSILSEMPSIFSLGAGQTRDIGVTIFVPATSAGSALTFIASSTYKDAYSSLRSITQSLGLSVNSRSPTSIQFSISIEPGTITTGSVSNLTLTLSNHGNMGMHTISASYSFPGSQVTLLAPDISQIASIEAGNSSKIAISVFAPTTTASSVLLQVSLKYYDDNGILTQETRTIGLLSKGIIDLELVDYSVIPKSPPTGQIFSVTATITNTGTVTAYSLTATPNLTSAFKIFGSRSIFIGDVQANTQTTFTLSLQVDNKTAPGDYPIEVELSFSDNLRNDISVTEEIPVTVSEPAQQQSTQNTQHPVLATLRQSAPYVVTGAAMLGVGLLLGKRFRKK